MVGPVGDNNSHFGAKLSVREQVQRAAHLAEEWCVRSDLLKPNDMPVQLDGYRAYVARNFPVGADTEDRVLVVATPFVTKKRGDRGGFHLGRKKQSRM